MRAKNVDPDLTAHWNTGSALFASEKREELRDRLNASGVGTNNSQLCISQS